jgi:acetyl-CoA C-acetyltransferase
MIPPSTPVIIGVGQFTERIESPDYKGLSNVEVATEAARRAFADAGNVAAITKRLDTIATTRSIEDSTPGPAVFGKSNNPPRSIAKRLGSKPGCAIWDIACGNSSQRLVAELHERIADGKSGLALALGAEAISTTRHLKSKGEKRDWAETIDGEVEDRGPGLKGVISRTATTHKLFGAPPMYALLEHARRGRLGLSRKEYARKMGELFAPFTEVAAANPYSSSAIHPMSAEELVTVTEKNRMIADPYPRLLVARDQVNQGAAVLVASVAVARELGIPESKWVYLHGYANAREREMFDRQDLGRYVAAELVSRAAVQHAGLTAADIACFDFYSCFPIPVFTAACEGLGLSPRDARKLTVTGGLPFFGGPGNNYSMHGVATVVERLRAKPGTYGFVGANGGICSKYAAGVYSTTPRPFKRCDSTPIQQEIDAAPAVPHAHEPEGWARIETYTVVYGREKADYAAIVGRLEDGSRFVANSADGDAETLERMSAEDPLDKRVYVRSFPIGNRFAFTAERLDQLFPAAPPVLKPKYEHVLIERRGHLLEITINRPEQRNCLHPPANDELAQIMDAFLADPDLWVAILTGAGKDAFCTGNDLKYTGQGKPMWVPKTGFGGLTSRVGRTKPVIAAVNGYAMGGGFEISLACDLIVADETAQFALSEVKVGLYAGAGGIVRLPRQLPRKLANELILTGKRLGAGDALRLGLVNKVVPAGTALEGARALAAEILEASPTSVRLSMQVMNEAEAYPVAVDAVRAPSKASDELMTSEDFFEGLAAFAQKRKPNWKNR